MSVGRLVLGTGNVGKIKEWSKILADEGFRGEILGVDSFKGITHPEETAETFEVNAQDKGVYYAKLIGEYVLSEDGGYEVDALGGAPGIKSRRILPGDKDGTDRELIDYVLERLKGIPKEKRTVKLTVAAAVSDPQGNIIYEDKESIGGVVTEETGPVQIPGYPFRSIHYIPELEKTYAELTDKEHEKFNHKKKIAKRLATFLNEQ